MKSLSREQRVAVIAALVQGDGIRTTCRLTRVAKAAVIKLLAQVGEAASGYQDRELRGRTTRRIQADEFWSFCYSKQKNIPLACQREYGVGDVWIWVAIDADSKLVLPFADRPYLMAVEDVFGADIDYATLQKLYDSDSEAEKRYSPAKRVGTEVAVVHGQPDPKHISTGYAERQNLTLRMQNRRFTRLINALSKKMQNHEHAVALHYLAYNFARPHKPLGSETHAMAAGLADHVWSTAEIVTLVEAKHAPPKKRGPCGPRKSKISD